MYKTLKNEKAAEGLINALELIAFKEFVTEKSKEKGDGGKGIANAMMGVNLYYIFIFHF